MLVLYVIWMLVCEYMPLLKGMSLSHRDDRLLAGKSLHRPSHKTGGVREINVSLAPPPPPSRC